MVLYFHSHFVVFFLVSFIIICHAQCYYLLPHVMPATLT